MEKYNRRMGGYEAQGNIEIRRNGCDQQTHRFYQTGCEEAEMKRRKVLLVVSAILMGVLVASIIGIIALLYMAIAYM